MGLNRKLFVLLLRRGGLRGLLGGMALHWLYYVYATGALAWVWLHSRWRFDGLARPRLTVGLTLILIAGVAAVGLIGLTAALTDPQRISRFAAGLGGAGKTQRLPTEAIVGIQRGLLLLSSVYVLLSAALVAIGPQGIGQVLRDLGRTIGRVPIDRSLACREHRAVHDLFDSDVF